MLAGTNDNTWVSTDWLFTFKVVGSVACSHLLTVEHCSRWYKEGGCNLKQNQNCSKGVSGSYANDDAQGPSVSTGDNSSYILFRLFRGLPVTLIPASLNSCTVLTIVFQPSRTPWTPRILPIKPFSVEVHMNWVLVICNPRTLTNTRQEIGAPKHSPDRKLYSSLPKWGQPDLNPGTQQ